MKGKHRTVIMTVISIVFLLPSLYGAHLDMMIGNDNKTFGLGRNLDDGRSFGSVIDFEYDHHHVNASLTGMTVKGYRTENGDVKGRYDSFNLGYGYLFDWNLGHDVLSLQPYVGVNLIGNLGMDWVQNAVHDALGRKKVYLPYDYEKVLIHPSVGLQLGWQHHFLDDFSFGLHDTLSYRIHFGLSNDIALDFHFGERLGFSLGYAFEKDLTGVTNSHAVQAIRDTGFFFTSSVHAGLFALEYRTNFSNMVSYGLVGMNPLAFMDMESFEDTGRTVSIGREWGYPSYMHRLIFTDHDWQIRSKYRTSEIEIGSEKRVANSSFALGYDFIWEKGIFSPFIAPWGGMSQYIYFKQDWTLNRPEILIQHYMPTIGFDAGVRILEKGRVRVGGSGFSIDVGLSLAWNMGAESVDLNGYEEFKTRVAPIEARGFLDLVFYL